MRRFVPRYEVVFSGGVFYRAEGEFLRSDITVFLGGNSQRTLSLHEYTFYVELHSHKTRAGGNSVISFKQLSLPPAPPDKLHNKFADGKLGQAAKLVAFFRHNTCSLQEMCGRRSAD